MSRAFQAIWVAQIKQQLMGMGNAPCGTEISHRYKTQSGLQRHDVKMEDKTPGVLDTSVSLLHVTELFA